MGSIGQFVAGIPISSVVLTQSYKMSRSLLLPITRFLQEFSSHLQTPQKKNYKNRF